MQNRQFAAAIRIITQRVSFDDLAIQLGTTPRALKAMMEDDAEIDPNVIIKLGELYNVNTKSISEGDGPLFHYSEAEISEVSEEE